VATASTIQLGARLRALRRERGYTLAQVARATSISKSFLALVESGKSDITITKLMRLTQFYGVNIADALPDASGGDVTVVRKGEEQHVTSPAEGIDVWLLSRHAGRALSPVIAVFEPGGESDISSHEGEEFLHVLDGRFELRLGADESIVLEDGDSAHFKADLPHTYRNVGDTEGRLLSIVTPAVF
jgi:quercetin dioxygenase-like cupin family protein